MKEKKAETRKFNARYRKRMWHRIESLQLVIAVQQIFIIGLLIALVCIYNTWGWGV